MPDLTYAHTRPGCGDKESWHLLDDHLRSTAERCRIFARRFAPQSGYLAGLWHDLGKYQAAFQTYLERSGMNCQDAGRAPHSSAGALFALQQELPAIGLVIAAHHGALKDPSDVMNLKRDRETIARLNDSLKHVPSALLKHCLPEDLGDSALWVRFLFSSLVDADSLDTETFYLGRERSSCPTTLPELVARLESELERKNRGAQDSAMNLLRREVQEAARIAASEAPGAFRLTVPTGGGKTFASLLFALRHAQKHGLERVIVVIPYTSIIDQTAQEYRRVLGDDAVLEHHSNLDPEKESLENRLASENWDRPVVVTTGVQFFETLYANHKRKLRKLHRVAGSVVVLDEVQTLPLDLLRPIRDALTRLRQDFGSTIVHCTATQPMLIDRDETKEIVPDPGRLFEMSRRRVQVRWPDRLQERTPWQEIASRIRAEPGRRVLAIVNKRADAIQLAELLGEECLHLSALMCAEHRRMVLREIRDRPKTDSCLVVSTQLVEAGVDLDFPVVYRAMAGFDSLAQAAGRCNREGLLEEVGRLEVFVPESQEPRYLGERTKSARSLLEQGFRDLFEPSVYEAFFAELAPLRAKDAKGITDLEARWKFPEVDKRFSMIEDTGTIPVIAPWGGSAALVAALRAGVTADRLRALQPYTVALYPQDFEGMQALGHLVPLFERSDDGDKTRPWTVIPQRATMVYDSRFGFGRVKKDEPSLIVD